MAFNCENGDGPYAFGYDILEGYPIETFGNNGLEVTVVYEGPYIWRHEFLDSIFGRWRMNRQQCCAQLLSIPRPFANSGEFVERPIVGDNGSAPVGPAGILWMNESDTLWPDTYSIANCGPEGHFDPMIVGLKVCPAIPSEQPLVLAPVSNYLDTYAMRCKAQVTINYREKSHARIPFEKCNCLAEDEGVAETPYEDASIKYGFIPQGTFAEIEVEPGLEFITVPNRNFNYALLDCPEEEALTIEFSNCERSDSSTLGLIDEMHVPEDVDAGEPITTTQIRVNWTNVPLPPFSHINQLSGTLNSDTFIGFPRGAVVFSQARYLARTTHRGERTWDLEYLFVAKTVRPTFGVNLVDLHPSLQECFPHICGVIGIWNRRFSACPIDFTIGGQRQICTHWVPIISGNNCNPADAEEPLPYANFQQLFYLPPTCPDPPVCDEVL